MKYTQEQWHAFARRLNDGGCPVLVQHGYKISPPGLVIERISETAFNEIFPLVRGGTGYEIDLVLRNEAPRPIDVVGFQIRTPWGIPRISLLPPGKKSSDPYPEYYQGVHYWFPDGGPRHERNHVINPFFARRKSRLLPGAELEGMLLALSEEIIPADVLHLARIIATLVIFDSRGNEYSAQFKLLVFREDVDARERRALVRARVDLQEQMQELPETVMCGMKLDPPPLPIVPITHKELNKQEMKEICQRVWEDLAAASERHKARIASGDELVSVVDEETEDQTALIERRFAEMKLERELAPDVDQAVDAGG